MMLIRLVAAELRYRPWSAVMTVLITVCAVVSVLFFLGLSEMMASRTRIIQRDLGLNVRFIPEGNSLDRYWLRGYADGAIDESLVDRLASQEVANRLVPMLQRTVPFGSGEAILTGVGEERFSLGQPAKPVFSGLVGADDMLILGQVAAEIAGLREGDSVELLGRRFRVARVLATEGSLDDLRVHAELPVVQELLGMTGKINEIRALECNCDESVADPEEQLRATLEPLLPGTMMIRHDKMADARRKQRQLADRMASVAAPFVVALAAVLVSALIMLNTYQRRHEIGLFSAVGKSYLFVAGVIWTRAVILGVAAGVLGLALARITLAGWGEKFVGASVQTPPWSIQWVWIGLCLGVAIPTFASLLPILTTARVDPAITLRRE